MSSSITVLPTDKPARVYYCKAYIATGNTVLVEYGNTGKRSTVHVPGVNFHGCTGSMLHGNSKGKSKASGARCVFEVTSGTIELLGKPEVIA